MLTSCRRDLTCSRGLTLLSFRLILPNMLNNDLTGPQLAALARLRLPEMEPLIELLRREIEDTYAILAKANEPVQIYRLQGKATALGAFIELVETSSERLSRHNGRP